MVPPMTADCEAVFICVPLTSAGLSSDSVTHPPILPPVAASRSSLSDMLASPMRGISKSARSAKRSVTSQNGSMIVPNLQAQCRSRPQRQRSCVEA